jgi:hypothetical protein
MLGHFGALAAGVLSIPIAGQPPRPRLHTTNHPDAVVAHRPPPALFAFHSNFWLNLHHFLYITARTEAGLDAARPVAKIASADTAGFGVLPASEQKEWRAAVAYYDSSLAHRDILFDSDMVAINNRLALLDSSPTIRSSDLDPRLIAILERAAPVYRRVWWSRHDAANHQWEARMRRLLALYGDSLATQESRTFHEPWSKVPVRVDVSAYANWAGAYTTTDPSHITVSSEDPGNQDDQGLEILFHEVLHTMDDSLASALGAAFRTEGKTLPRDPTHVFIFYTAGALTQRMMPGHVPYAAKNGLWAHVADFARALPVLQRCWQPYLDGKITFAEAIQRYASSF